MQQSAWPHVAVSRTLTECTRKLMSEWARGRVDGEGGQMPGWPTHMSNDNSDFPQGQEHLNVTITRGGGLRLTLLESKAPH